MKESKYQDYLIEKPLCLVYWNLNTSFDTLRNYFLNDFEIKEIKGLEDLIYWSRIASLKMIIIGVKDLEEVKELTNFLNEKFPITKRRELFLIYVLPEIKTLDPKETFLLSANLVISESHLSDFEKIYQKAHQYWTNLYKDFKFTYEQLKKEI